MKTIDFQRLRFLLFVGGIVFMFIIIGLIKILIRILL